MEHYPLDQPMDRKKWIGFDAFDALMDEALADLPAPTPEPGSLTLLPEPAEPSDVQG